MASAQSLGDKDQNKSEEHIPIQNNGTQKLLCGNVTKFLIAKNGCAHRVQRTGISLGLIFHVSGSLIFQDFWDWKLKSRVLCTARYVHSVSANLKILFLFESSSQNLHLVVFSASPDIRIDRKWRHLEFFDFRIIRLIHRIWDDRNSMIMTSLIKIRYKIQKFISQKIFCKNFYANRPSHSRVIAYVLFLEHLQYFRF